MIQCKDEDERERESGKERDIFKSDVIKIEFIIQSGHMNKTSYNEVHTHACMYEQSLAVNFIFG